MVEFLLFLTEICPKGLQTKTPLDFGLSLDFSQLHHHAQTIHPSWSESCMDRQMGLQELTRIREKSKTADRQTLDSFSPERASWKVKAIHQAFSLTQSSSCHTVVSPIWAERTKCTNLTAFKNCMAIGFAVSRLLVTGNLCLLKWSLRGESAVISILKN